MVGIMHCATHKPEAVRDCNRFLHEAGQVRLIDARRHPLLITFFAAIPQSFSVRRTGGILDLGWAVPLEGGCTLLRRTLEGEWLFPVEKPSEGISKSIPVSAFIEIAPDFITQDMITTVRTVLDNGIYSSA